MQSPLWDHIVDEPLAKIGESNLDPSLVLGIEPRHRCGELGGRGAMLAQDVQCAYASGSATGPSANHHLAINASSPRGAATIAHLPIS